MRLTTAAKDRISSTATERAYPTAHEDDVRARLTAEFNRIIRFKVTPGWEQFIEYIPVNAQLVIRGRRGITLPTDPFPRYGVVSSYHSDDLPPSMTRLYEEWCEWCDARDQFRANIKTVLKGYTTTSQLEEVSSPLAVLAAEVLAAEREDVPRVLMDDINRKLS